MFHGTFDVPQGSKNMKSKRIKWRQVEYDPETGEFYGKG